MKKKINLVYSSHLSEIENSNFEKHVNETCGVPIDIYCYVNHNQYSLSEIYNKSIKEINCDNESIIVFSHNDIEFDTKNWGKILLKHFNNKNFDYQIIGVAGVESIYSGCWWLDENNQMNFKEMVGIVNHFNGIRKWESKYSEPFFGIKPVAVIDGLFMAVNVDDIEHLFDERFKGFHFYDMSFVFPNTLDGCNVGVVSDIRITHKSIGETNQQWLDNKEIFEELYREYIPFKIKDYL